MKPEILPVKIMVRLCKVAVQTLAVGQRALSVIGDAVSQENPSGGANEGARVAKPKRRLRNFLLQPMLQVRLGLYSVLLSFIFSFVISAVFYFNFKGLYDIALKFTDLPDEFQALFTDQIRESIFWAGLSVLSFVIATLIISVVYTHRLVGPTYAFRRHIHNLIKGNYQSRVSLRRHDAFLEVAEDLNRLAENLENRR